MKKVISLLFIGFFTVLFLGVQEDLNAGIIQTHDEVQTYYEDWEFFHVESGFYNSAALSLDGRVFTWGNNYYGQLGDSNHNDINVPTEITDQFNLTSNETIISIKLGFKHALALSSSGRVFSWGDNDYGKLGDGMTTDRAVPNEITSQFALANGETIVSISTGENHSAAVSSNGRVFTWGSNQSGILGIGSADFETHSNPIDISSKFSLNSGETVVDLSLGSSHSAAITSDGRVFTWGYNGYGQLGLGDVYGIYEPTDLTNNFSLSQDEKIIDISLAGRHSAAITSNGRVFTWGWNMDGQLGDGSQVDKNIPTEITNAFNLYSGEYIKDIIVNYNHSAAVTSVGRLFRWGNNLYGALGNGGTNNLINPTDVTNQISLDNNESIMSISLGAYHASILTSNDRHFAVGWNDDGQLGDGSFDDKTTPVEIILKEITIKNSSVFNNENFKELLVGNSHSAALTYDGRVYTWGYNNYGQLGNGTTIDGLNPLDITSQFALNQGETIIDLSLKDNNSSAITSAGRVFVWGSNSYGVLGDGTNINRFSPVDISSQFSLNVGELIVEIFTGSSHSIAISNQGRLFTWGRNNYGQLGIGTTDYSNHESPIDITNQFALNTGESIVGLSKGLHHSAIFTSEGRVFTWGYNGYGQLGDSGTVNSDVPIDITSQFSLGENEKIINVTLGYFHSLAISSENRVFTWGYNQEGELGLGSSDFNPHSIPVDITGQFSLEVDESIIKLFGGRKHSAAITSEGRIFFWGLNEYGQLGDGTLTNRLIPTDITSQFSLNTSEKVIDASLGEAHSLVVTSSSKIYIWGLNDHGQLGDGTNLNQNQPRVLTSPNEILSTYTSVANNYLLDSLTLTIIPEYMITNEIESISINGIDEYHFSNIDGKIEVYINNTWNLGDVITFELNSITFTNGLVKNLSGDLSASTLLIEDIFEPTINFNYEYNIFVEKDLGYDQLLDAIAYDDTGEALDYNVFGNVDWSTPGEYRIIYSSSDGYGNTKTRTRLITVMGDIDASGTVLNDMIFTNFDSESLSELTNYTNQVITFDNIDYYSNSDQSQLIYELGYNNVIFEFYIEDRFVIVSKDVLFEDTIAPTFSIEDQTIELGVSDIDWTTYMTNIEDNSNLEITLVETEDLVDYGQTGTYSVTVTASDVGNNQNSQTIDVTVEDTTPPTFDVIENQYVELGADSIDWTTYIFNGQDNSADPLIYSIVQDTVEYDAIGTYNVQVKLSDSSGNETSQSFDVTVQDTTPPTFDTIDNQYVEINTDSIDWVTYILNAQDNSEDTLIYSVIEDTVEYDTIGTYNVQVKLSDSSGNETSQSFDVTIQDTTPPTFDAPMGETIEVYAYTDIDWTTYVTNISDNSGSDVEVVEFNDLVIYDTVGWYPVTLKISDAYGNFTYHEMQVGVEDYTRPTFDIIETQTIEAGMDDIDWTIFIENASDNYSQDLLKVEFIDSVDYNTPGTYSVTVSVYDEMPNEASQTFSVIVVDTTPPTFDTIESQTIEAGVEDIDWSTSIYNQSDNSDGTLTPSELEDNVIYDLPGTYTVSVILRDESGNEASRILSVTVEDTTLPTFDLDDFQIIEAGLSDIDWTQYIYNVSDNANQDIELVEIEDLILYNSLGEYIVTVQANDMSGNQSTRTINVRVVDTTQPMIILNGHSDIIIEVGTAYIEQGAMFSDNYGINENIVITGTIDTNVLGTYTLSYNLTDLEGNQAETVIRTIHVVDTTPPILEVEDQVVEVGTQIFNWETFIVSASDNYSTSLDFSISEGDLDYSTVGIYQVTIYARDESGNDTSQNLMINVIDTTPPTFDDIEDQSIEAGQEDFDWTTLITNALDNYSLDLVFTESHNIDYDSVGSYSVDLSVSDASGNTLVKSFTLNVLDTTGPEFVIEDQTIEAGSIDIDWTEYITDATDNARGSLNLLEVEDNVIYDTPGIYTVTLSVSDESNNETEKIFSVEVIDTTPPSYNITIEAGLDDIDWTEYVTDVSDNASGDISILEVEDNIDYNTPGTYSVLLSVIDKSLNESMATLNVTVQDTIHPQVSLNPSIDSIEVGSSYTEYGITALDVTDTSLTIIGEVDTLFPGVYELSYIVSDTSGNETVIKRYVTVYEKQMTVSFDLGPAKTTLMTGEDYHDGTCHVSVDEVTFTCDVKENNVDVNTPGVYWVMYSFNFEGQEHTYTRFVFVLGSYEDIQAYLPILKEDEDQ